MLRGLGLRDKEGVELRDGDQVKIVFYDRRTMEGNVHYDKANAVWMIGKVRICDIGRDKGTTLEVVRAMAEAKPLSKRRKSKHASGPPEQGGTRENLH